MDFALDRNFRNIQPAEVAADGTPAGEDCRCARGQAGFARLLGAAWSRLDPAIRERFGGLPLPGRPRIFAGRYRVVRRSAIGWIFALLCRAIGQPLPLSAGRSVPARVVVSRLPGNSGVEWRRYYGFAGGTALCRTVKREDAVDGLLECVGRRFGMSLSMSEEGGALRFDSRRFYLQLGGWRLTWPLLLSPGRMTVLHRAEAGGAFRFRLVVRHPLFGETFFQDGLFRQMEG